MMRALARSRGVRRLLRNRLAVVALVVVAAYIAVGLGVRLFGIITLEEATEKVGAPSSPGFFRTGSLEDRALRAEFYLEEISALLERDDPAAALADYRLAERRVASIGVEEVERLVDELETTLDALDEFDELAGEDAERVVEQLDAIASSLFPLPRGGDGFRYAFRTLLGTDRQGRSISVAGVYSIKVAIEVGAITALVSVILGSLLGAAAAYFGGVVDHAVIWLYSTLSSIPNLVLLLVLVFMFSGRAVENTLIPVYCAFCLTFWIGPCRVIRGEVLKIRELEYVQAAQAVGFRPLYILIRHVVPNTAHLMFINFSLLFIGAIKSEVILSFLDLGVKEGPSWGIMISHSRQEVINGFFWQIGTATVLMFGLVLAFNVLTDALQDAFDPKHVA